MALSPSPLYLEKQEKRDRKKIIHFPKVSCELPYGISHWIGWSLVDLYSIHKCRYIADNSFVNVQNISRQKYFVTVFKTILIEDYTNSIFLWASKGLFMWEKLSRLDGEIISTRPRHNASFHQQKSLIHMCWKFPRLTEVSPIVDRDLGHTEKYFLIWMHFPGWVKTFFPTEQVQEIVT